MIVPDGRRRAGTGMVPSRNQRYAVCGCTPLRRAHSASFTEMILTLTDSYVCSRKSEQLTTLHDVHDSRRRRLVPLTRSLLDLGAFGPPGRSWWLICATPVG